MLDRVARRRHGGIAGRGGAAGTSVDLSVIKGEVIHCWRCDGIVLKFDRWAACQRDDRVTIAVCHRVPRSSAELGEPDVPEGIDILIEMEAEVLIVRLQSPADVRGVRRRAIA